MNSASQPHQEDLPGIPASKNLAFRESESAPLSREQKAFNRELKRIEKLRQKLKSESAALNEAIAIYESEIRPLHALRVDLLKEMVRTLAPFREQEAFRKGAALKQLTETLQVLLSQLLDTEGDQVDDDLQELADSLLPKKTTFDPIRALLLEELKRSCQKEGLDIDLSDITPDSDPQELVRRFEAAQQAKAAAEGAPQPPPFAREAPPAPQPRPKTKKQLEREARLQAEEEARKRTLSSIYKQLAKVLHPDLEPDPKRKDQKLRLMQQLTAAYRANDLHTLLRLELEWLHREGEDVEHLSIEKLKIFTKVLKEQADDLRHELETLALHPRFAPLVRYPTPFAFEVDFYPRQQLPHLLSLIQGMKLELQGLGAPPNATGVRAFIRQFCKR